MKYFIIIAFFLSSFCLSQDSIRTHHHEWESESIGILAFDWSGHLGIYHRYGFPGWGSDIDEESLFIDGNFAHWPGRYAFPFKKRLLETGDEPGVRSSVWYRTGDYFLDEFAFDINFKDEGFRSTRFQALKRNFEDQYGLFGPVGQPGGTIQQNYRLSLQVPNDLNGKWNLSSAYFKTTDVIPTQSDQGWAKGVSRLDRILTNSLSYKREGDRVKSLFDFSAFSQRLKMKALLDAPEWGADLITYRIRSASKYLLDEQRQRFYEVSGKYSALSSDSLGNQSRIVFSGVGGFQKQMGGFEYNVGLGGAFVSPDRSGLILDAAMNYSLTGSNTFFFKVNHSLNPLPFQFSGRRINWYPDFPPDQYNSVKPNSTAISQERTIVQLGTAYLSSRTEIQIRFFTARGAPHYYFENGLFVDSPYGYDLVLMKMSSDNVSGVSWHGEINYFRNWRLAGDGISLFKNKKGWGNGIQHEGTVALTFQELLFRERLDMRLKVWTNFWIGRNRYIWDPIVSLGYFEYNDVYSQDATGMLNIEFKGIISSFEVSYTMMNVLFAGRTVIRNLLGNSITDEQLSFSATPFLPPLGRLAYIAVKWNFKD